MPQVIVLVRRGGAVRTALGLGDTIALGLLPPGEEAPLVAARRAGATRAIALWSPALAEVDYLGLAQAIASAVRHLGFGGVSATAKPFILLAGEGSRAAIGPAVAERLALPHLSGVVSAALDGDEVVAHRRAAGASRRYSCAPPLLLCVAGPPLPAASDGKTPENDAPGELIERLDLAAIGLDAAELAWRKRLRLRPAAGPEPRPRRFSDAAALAARLVADGVVPARSKV